MHTASTACSTASTISASPWSSRTRSSASSKSRRPRARGRERTGALGHQLQHIGPSLDSLGLEPALLDRLCDRDRAARHVGMQALDHAAVELHDALVPVPRQIECRDDLLRLGNVFRARRKGGVARPDLIRMDEGLAVEAHVSRLAALAREALGVAEVVVDAVEDVEAEGPRPGVIFARVSLARSLVPITKAARRVSTSLVAAAMSRALSMASGVSIIAQTRIFWSALMSTRRSPTSSRWLGLDTFGTSTASGLALATALRSSSHHSVSRPLMRTMTSRAPKEPVVTASNICWRAAALPSGATESSRSRMTASAGKVRALSIARALDAGIYSTLRRGRMLMLMPRFDLL